MTGPTPTERRRERIGRALANPIYFGEVYVRPFDQNWNEPLPRFASEMLAFALSVRRGVIILPPEFLKTTLVSQLLPLWLTVRASMLGKVIRGLLLSEEEGMATQNLAVLKWHIEHNDLLKGDFADSQGRPLVRPDETEPKWTDDAIIVARPGTSKDPTWQAKGLNSAGVQGRRLDWLIGDDVITPVNAFSPAKRESALRDWDMQFTTRLVESGKAIVAGNFNDPHDLVSTIARRSEYKVFKRPGYSQPDDPTKFLDPSNPASVPLWPQNWSKERGLREKREKPTSFIRIFGLTAASEKGNKLRTDWVTFIDDEETPLPYCRYFISLDVAVGGEGETDDLDYTTITVAAAHNAHLDIIESFALRNTLGQQIAVLSTLHDRYQRLGQGVLAIGGAKVAMDRLMRSAITIVRPDLEPKLYPVSVPGAKEERLEGLGPHVRTGYVRIRRSVWDARTSDPEDQSQEMTLHEEWKDFPLGRHDDRLDGVDLVIRTARDFEAYDQETEVEVTASHAH